MSESLIVRHETEPYATTFVLPLDCELLTLVPAFKRIYLSFVAHGVAIFSPVLLICVAEHIGVKDLACVPMGVNNSLICVAAYCVSGQPKCFAPVISANQMASSYEDSSNFYAAARRE